MEALLEQVCVLHLSDLHTNHIIANNQFGWVPGWRAHEFLLCKALSASIENIRSDLEMEGKPLRLVVSGDLTATGGAKEFPVAHSLLRSLWRVRRLMPGGEVGFRVVDEQMAVVAGNHDQWNGQTTPPVSLNAGLAPSHFRRTPWKKEWREGSLVIEVFGIDSNAGLTGTNWRARGRYAEEDLVKLRDLLESANDAPPKGSESRVRVIVTHHSPSYLAPVYSRPFHCTELDPRSREDLVKICEDHRVTAVLTGHTHDFLFKRLTPRSGGPMELRSASALQGPESRVPAPGFLVHRVKKEKSQTIWAAWRYGFDGTRFVRKNAAPCIQFDVK
jgi:3',5'-cyclic AMP phosphodiesterase CpdA